MRGHAHTACTTSPSTLNTGTLSLKTLPPGRRPALPSPAPIRAPRLIPPPPNELLRPESADNVDPSRDNRRESYASVVDACRCNSLWRGSPEGGVAGCNPRNRRSSPRLTPSPSRASPAAARAASWACTAGGSSRGALDRGEGGGVVVVTVRVMCPLLPRGCSSGLVEPGVVPWGP
jgi:hypothetical protein